MEKSVLKTAKLKNKSEESDTTNVEKKLTEKDG